MLTEKCFDRIVIGASTMQDFDHQTQLMGTIDSGEEHPLDEIFAVGESESGIVIGSDGEDKSSERSDKIN
jgi:hypothetical protein